MSTIEWTQQTWNPTVGCTEVSPGCGLDLDGQPVAECYAAVVAARQMQDAHKGLTIRTPSGVRWTGEVRLLPDRLATPLQVKRPTIWFVDSMSDLFHPEVPWQFIADVWAIMARTPHHTYQVLTKRPARMARLLGDPCWDDKVEERIPTSDPVDWQDGYVGQRFDRSRWLPNVWCGTSIELDRYAWRADRLRDTPAAVRFLSCEPLLGPLPSLDLSGVGWVIVGGQSGPRAVPMDPAWARDLRDRSVAAGVPFFFKQWGAWAPGAARPAGKKHAGRVLDGRTWDELPRGEP